MMESRAFRSVAGAVVIVLSGIPGAAYTCRRALVVLWVALNLGFLSLSVSGQDRLERRNKSYDYIIGGVQFRVPGSYMQPTIIPGRVDDHLSFAFWASDGKPEQAEVPPIGERGRVGRAVYWPSEPGRPFFSSEDFVVLVREARPMERSQALERQQWLRGRVTAGGGPIAIEDGLECHTYPTGYKYCVTPAGTDPDVGMNLKIMPNNPSWRMSFYSRVDSLWVQLDFPELGQPRWPDVVCRTLLLIRSWRISDGPPTPDCSKRPRLSLVDPRKY